MHISSKGGIQGKSKILVYEIPYFITGGVKYTGLEQAPKSIVKTIESIGTWETMYMRK